MLVDTDPNDRPHKKKLIEANAQIHIESQFLILVPLQIEGAKWGVWKRNPNSST